MDFLTTCIDKIAQHFGRIDILINNAGIAHNAPFEETKMEDFDRIMNINVKVPFVLCRRCFHICVNRIMLPIINIASVVAHKGYVNQAIYTASKHALRVYKIACKRGLC